MFKIFVPMKNEDIETLHSFCDAVKMTVNEDVKRYQFATVEDLFSKSSDAKDFSKQLRKVDIDNILLANFGKDKQTCKTVSIWYAPKKYVAYAVRIEEDTYINYRRSDLNCYLFDTVYREETTERYSSKQSEHRFEFTSLHDALTFFETILNNYRTYVQSTAKEATETVAMKEA